uniref:Methenyltetrahydrofolate synthase domain-containing protein n=1 Tax=Anolis carolinensis TaxID=28377 RepID=A0A803TZT7_ANOCA
METGEQVVSSSVSKADIRQNVWDFMEANNLADFPRPVHHRIPNFKGASSASARLPDLGEFQKAQTGSFKMGCSIEAWGVFDKAREVKVDPDKPLEGIRLAALQARKTLLVPTPRLRTGLFNRIVPPPGATKEMLRKCATSQGVRDYSVPVGLDAKVQVDLVVVGSVAVSEKGWRIGKGEGYADMEYAMMVSMGAVKEDTVVVTAVHDCQVVDIPEALLADHDLTVDYILTPTRTIKTGCKRPKPQGILWHKISPETLAKIPVLKNLLYREKQEGKEVTLKEEKSRSPTRVQAAKPERARPQGEPQQMLERSSPDKADQKRSSCATVYVGNISHGIRVSELKEALRERHASPMRLTWQGGRHQAFLIYNNQCTADAAIEALQGLSLKGHPLRVEPARNQS